MFEDPSGKLRTIAKAFFWIEIVGAAVMLVSGFFFLASGGWAVSLSAIGVAFSAWVSTIVLLTLADAADGALDASGFSARILRRMTEPEGKETERPATPVATNLDGTIPAWQRIELENRE